MLNQFESTQTKKCSKCNKVKSVSDFRKASRYVDGFFCWCSPCEKEYQKKEYLKNKDRIKQRHKKYQKQNLELFRLYTALWKKKNPEYAERANQLRRVRYDENKNHILQRNRIFYTNNKRLFFAKNAKRKASLLRRCPRWVCKKEINDFYEKCPKGYHVDHIIPLQGKNVCGLHVIWNLQYLTAQENLKKGIKISEELESKDKKLWR